jgi:hypothetical protein
MRGGVCCGACARAACAFALLPAAYLYLLALQNPDKPFCTLPPSQRETAHSAPSAALEPLLLKQLSRPAAAATSGGPDGVAAAAAAAAAAAIAGSNVVDTEADDKAAPLLMADGAHPSFNRHQRDVDVDDQVAYEAHGSFCSHNHATDLDAASGEVYAEDGPGPFQKPDYDPLPPKCTHTCRLLAAHVVIWVPTAMCVPAIILWLLESFTSYKGR